jgi:hypothetical protein
MSDYTGLFERASARFRVPDLPIEGMLQRRDRKRRNQRIAAGVVGIAVALAAILAGTSVIRSDSQIPVSVPSIQGAMHNGDITFMVSDGLWGISSEGSPTRPLPTACCDPAGGWIQGADWSPDGTRFAYGVLSRQPKTVATGVYVVDAASGETHRVTEGPVQSVEWSPDGSTIAYSDFSTIRVVAAGGADRTTVWDGSGSALDPSWSPDGTRITFAVPGRTGGGEGPSEGEVHVIDAVGTADRVIAKGTVGPSSAPAWSPDGSTIAYIDGCYLVLISPDRTGPVLRRDINGCLARGMGAGRRRVV